MPTRRAGLFSELRRRKVFRVAGVYLVGAWAALQVGDVVIEPLGLPAWTMTLLIVLTACGLPIAISLAWVFDLTTEGVKRTEAWDAGEAAAVSGTATPGAPLSLSHSRSLGFIGVGILIGLVVVGTYTYVDRPPADEGEALRSVAVLPFVNMSGDPQNEYFSDGITEELLDALAGVPGLRVPARTSSFQFKGENIDVREVGRKLGVRAVLEGSVRKAGDRVRITAQLIDAETGYHLWSESYNRELSDIFAVQSEIAATIVGKLRMNLAAGRDADGEDGAGAATSPERAAATANMQAHDSYLLGRYHFHRRHLLAAERHFTEAVAADPSYAQAYAGLALTYAVLPLFDPETTIQEAVREGRAAARKALALDPSLADAHAALGQIAQNYEWDWDTAERHYDRAVQLAPNDPTIRHWRAEVLVVRGQPNAAREVEAALALDPLSPIANSVTALTHLLISRDYARSEELWRRVAEIEPDFPLLVELSVQTSLAREDWEQARQRLFRLAATAADSQAYAAWADAAAAVAGGERLDDRARELAFDAARRYGEAVKMGDVGAAILLGPIDPDASLDLIAGSLDEPRHRHPLSWVGRFWFFDPLHDDPRYRRLMRNLGLAG